MSNIIRCPSPIKSTKYPKSISRLVGFRLLVSTLVSATLMLSRLVILSAIWYC